MYNSQHEALIQHTRLSKRAHWTKFFNIKCYLPILEGCRLECAFSIPTFTSTVVDILLKKRI